MIQSPGVEGLLTPAEAMTRLLMGTSASGHVRWRDASP